MKAIYTTVLLLFCITVFAQEELTSFQGWEWGTSFEEVADQLEEADTRTTRGLEPYNKIGEEKVYEGIEVDNIFYLFKKDKFVAATVAMHNDHLDEIVEIFTQKYGEPKVVEAFVLKNHEWHIPTADIAITKIPSASNGIGVSVQIMGK